MTHPLFPVLLVHYPHRANMAATVIRVKGKLKLSLSAYVLKGIINKEVVK
jgi:hypothetical protein